eukprot:jgi/Bigna1/88962/estExt_fgenesh1_pg.C_410076
MSDRPSSEQRPSQPYSKAFKCGKDKQYAILVKRDEGMNQSRPSPSVSDEKDAYGRHVVSLADDTDFFIEIRNEHKERWCDVVVEMAGNLPSTPSGMSQISTRARFLLTSRFMLQRINTALIA